MIVLRIKNKLVTRAPKRRAMGGRAANLEPGNQQTHAVGFQMPEPPEGDWPEDRVGFVFRRPQ